MYLRLPCLLVSILFSTASLSGIELFLKNGDRLQGELVVESDDHLTILHPILGEIEIAKSALAELPILEPEQPEPDPVKMEEPTLQPEPAKLDEPMVKAIPRLIWNTPMGFVALLKEMNSKVGFSFSDQASKRDQTDVRFSITADGITGIATSGSTRIIAIEKPTAMSVTIDTPEISDSDGNRRRTTSFRPLLSIEEIP